MRYVLITGAGGGMGKKTVEAFLKSGFSVIALDLKEGSPQPGVTWVQADITNEEAVKAAVETVHRITDRLFAIIHFTGIYLLDSLVELGDEAMERAFQINVLGAVRVNRLFLPLLGADSRILITTSELAPLDPLPFTGLYGVTKAALDKYAFSLRMELQLLDIRVSVLRAGAVDTGMLGVSTAALERFCEKTSLYRCNSVRFRRIVDRVEARSISPEKLARRVYGIVTGRRPRFAYSINRNPLLLLMHCLPKGLQLWCIKMILK